MLPAMQPQVTQAATSHVFAALADPTRRGIFEHLARDGEQNVRALTTRAGVSQPAVSKHLGILKHARLVSHRRAGRETHYTAQPQALKPLLDWMGIYAAFWHDRFDRLESLLKRMEQ
jgi:DNA-binding transcriptional ArsR family regulator